jgi:hypothetical protein
MKKKYIKAFFHRGLIFGGFGPVTVGIIFWILSYHIKDFSLGGKEVFAAIASTYLLAFIHAGASVFNQIEEWPIAKSLFWHFLTLYLAYAGCYLLNAWIPFEPLVLGIFTGVFLVVYFSVWLIVVLSIKAVSKKLNRNIK